MRSSGPLLGSTTPRIWTPPLAVGPPGPCGCGCALTPATSLGFSAVDFARDVLEIEPLPWQRWLLIHSMELLPGGRFRFRTILVLVGRQNGKTTIVEVKNLWKMYVLRVPLVIGTAQNLDIAEESWDKAVEIAESIPDLAAEIVHVDRTNGKKALRLAAGPRWKIAAASRKGGRGLSGDDVNLDELREHQNWLAWGAVTKTTMARPNAQVWAYSNAGDDASVVLNDLQAKGRAAAANPDAGDLQMGFFEWSAPDGCRCTCVRPEGEPHRPECSLWDRSAWSAANPSLGYGRITEQAIVSALNTDPEAIFRTEVLCQRVETLEPDWRVIAENQWLARQDRAARMMDPIVLAADVTRDRGWSAIVAAGPAAAGGRVVDVIDHRPGTAWVVPRLRELARRHRPLATVTADRAIRDAAEQADKAARDSGDDLQLGVLLAGTGDMVASSSRMYDGVAGADSAGRDIWHLGQPALTVAVRGAGKTGAGDGWRWARNVPNVDICPLVAASLAIWALGTPRVQTQQLTPFAMT